MSSRIRKILKHTVIAVLSLAVLFLVLNLFLTGRLERYLKRELIERMLRMVFIAFLSISFLLASSRES